MKSTKFIYLQYSQLTSDQKKQADEYLKAPCFIKSNIADIRAKAKFQFISDTNKLRGALL